MKNKWTIFMVILCLFVAACTAETSFQDDPSPVTTAGVEHQSISFTYEPALWGEPQIQEIPASSNQGMFEQPSPAHTWIGFAPAGIQRDISNHWALAWEPSLTVYKLHDFGSFATGDGYARERVALFQQLLSERPLTISDPIPVIPPMNAGQIIRAQVEWLDFDNGTGVRFLTQYDQAVNPINNEGLVYIFQGMTDDGVHGITAVFPLDAIGLPDGPALSEADYTAFLENFDTEMTAVTNYLNTAPDADFTPSLAQLDALVESIHIPTTQADLAVTAIEPLQRQLAIDTNIYSASEGDEVIGNLQAGEVVIVNATYHDGRCSRILCPNGSTSDCWVATDAIQAETAEANPVFYTGGGMEGVGAVVEITAVADNAIHEGPGETYRLVGTLKTGETVSVFGPDETGQWVAVDCPRNIGLACWVVSDTAVNEPTGFFAGDGWQDVTSEYVSFRVPADWQVTAVTPGTGSVLAEWHLGIPGVESDQTLAFSAVPFENLTPTDIVQEDKLLIGEQPGFKWLRSGEGYISYDYYTAGTDATQAAGAGSFGLHVTVAEANLDLETTLDMVVNSVIFNTPPEPDVETAVFTPRFDHFLPFAPKEGGNNMLTGLVRQGESWQLVSASYPTETNSIDSDYALTTDRLLAWRMIGGAGPGNLAVGNLNLVNVATNTSELVVPENVISAGWAPNGLDFAYILATPTTYELRWHTSEGQDKLLAIDVPHSLRVSPDGRFVAFTRESHYEVTTTPGLYVVEIETGLETQVSTLDRAGYGGTGLYWKPQWTPDSSQLLLYATSDDDRAATPHEAGFAWAAVDGSFSHFLPESTLLAQIDEPLTTQDGRHCLDTPLLFAADVIVVGIGECLPMAGQPEGSRPAYFTLDAQSGTATFRQFLTELPAAHLLTWDTPAESVLLLNDDKIISQALPASNTK